MKSATQILPERSWLVMVFSASLGQGKGGHDGQFAELRGGRRLFEGVAGGSRYAHDEGDDDQNGANNHGPAVEGALGRGGNQAWPGPSTPILRNWPEGAIPAASVHQERSFCAGVKGYLIFLSSL